MPRVIRAKCEPFVCGGPLAESSYKGGPAYYCLRCEPTRVPAGCTVGHQPVNAGRMPRDGRCPIRHVRQLDKPPVERFVVYHGTAEYALADFFRRVPDLARRSYLPRPAFSTSTERRVAELFAVRRTSAEDFMARRVTGIVLEFRLAGRRGLGWDFAPTRDPMCQHEEHEIAVFEPGCLTLAAVWRHAGGDFTRTAWEALPEVPPAPR